MVGGYLIRMVALCCGKGKKPQSQYGLRNPSAADLSDENGNVERIWGRKGAAEMNLT
jgi:hypothetical protein